MNIDAIGSVTGLVPGIGVQGAALTGTQATQATQAGGATSGLDFAAAIDQVQGLQSQSSALAVKAVTGDLDDVHDYTIASSQAAVALELTAAVRNKAVEAFTEIMRMQA
ncbi:flagellar hook-basal body complex protein FliE [Actinotalea sp. AC32]|nr:flagellar hook-basal body complex protein FliE [Actinotalea sp. AC32]